MESPEFAETAPYELPPNRRNHGVPMILTEVAGELARTTGDAAIARAADDYAARVMNHFVRPHAAMSRRIPGSRLSRGAAARRHLIMPGHAIESMWFQMHRALARNDRQAIRDAAEVLRWHLEKGWDKEYGGIFLGMDAGGHPPLSAQFGDQALVAPHRGALCLAVGA